MKPALIRLREGLHRHFGPGAAVFVDPFLWMAGYVTVDVVRLDDWLLKRNPDYRDGESMREFIRRKHGDRAVQFIEHWITGEQVGRAETWLASRDTRRSTACAGMPCSGRPSILGQIAP